MELNRETALSLLNEYTKNPALIKHMLAVEAALAAYAKKFNEDENLWRIIGILHDFDYEQNPDLKDHTNKGAEILRERGVSEEIIHTIRSHNDYNKIPRQTLLEKTLYTVDELCGFTVAVALVRPSKAIADVQVKSVKKKLKDKAFARQVNREEIRHGAEQLGVELDEHIQTVLDAMKGISAELGL